MVCKAARVSDNSVIEAAGGLLWRPAERGVEIALVHRPKYDDWSVPKGKLMPDEQAVLGALREVKEETGSAASLGRPLGKLRYRINGAQKRVRYWVMQRNGDDPFEPGDEVDEVEWLPPRAATRRLQAGRDADVLAWYSTETRPSWPFIVLRHASAGDSSAWPGDDAERPLDELGRQQADAMAPILGAYAVECAWSADVTRCRETVQPLTAGRELDIGDQPAVSEAGYRAAPEEAEQWLIEAAASGVPTVVCSQGKSIPGLVKALCASMDAPTPRGVAIRKGGAWVFHLARGSDRLPDIVSVERLPPLA